MSTTLNKLLEKLDGVKTAADNAQPPSEGHPSDHIEGHLAVPQGDTVTSAADEQVDRIGRLAAGGNPVENDKEKLPDTGGTTKVLDGTSTPSELNPGEGLKDPGPDSSHPASPNKNDKYASAREIGARSAKTAAFVLGHLQAALATAKEASAAATSATTQPAPSDNKQAAAPTQQPAQTPAAQSSDPEVKYASALNDLIPAAKRETAYKVAMQTVAPFVAEGIARANKLANFMAAAEQDPQAASAMLGDPGAGGGMGGADPSMVGGMAGDPGMGAGDGSADLQQLFATAQKLSEQAGCSVPELLMSLAQAMGPDGGGDPGMGGDPGAGGDSGMGGGAGAAPPSTQPASDGPGAAPSKPKSGEGGSPSKSEESSEGEEEESDEGKTAAAPGAGKPGNKTARRMDAIRREVSALLDEAAAGDR